MTKEEYLMLPEFKSWLETIERVDAFVGFNGTLLDSVLTVIENTYDTGYDEGFETGCAAERGINRLQQEPAPAPTLKFGNSHSMPGSGSLVKSEAELVCMRLEKMIDKHASKYFIYGIQYEQYKQTVLMHLIERALRGETMFFESILNKKV